MPTADKADFEQDEPWHPVIGRLITEGIAGVGITTSGDFDVTATATDLEIQVAAGTMWYEGSEHTLGSADTHTLSAGDATNDRYDTVVFDTSTDSSSVKEGTAGATPVPPDVTGDEVLLSVVYVASGATDVTDSEIVDFRPTHQGADETRFDDSTWTPTAADVQAALEELQEGADITAHPLKLADLDSPFSLPALTDMDASGNDLVDGGTTVWDTSEGFVPNEQVQALASLTGDETFTEHPFVIGTDVAAHLGGNDLLSASGGDTVYDTSESEVPRARIDQNKVTKSIASGTDTSDEELIFVDTSSGAFPLTLSSADAVDGNEIIVVDIGGSLETNALTIDTEGGETIDGENSITMETNFDAQRLASNGTNWFTAGGGSGGAVDHAVIFEGRESGSVSAGNQGVLVADNLANSATVEVYKAALTKATVEAVPSGVDLELVTFDNAGAFTSRATLIAGDGTTVFDDETGSPLGSYTNSTGSAQSIGVIVDNGFGSGVDVMAVVEGETDA